MGEGVIRVLICDDDEQIRKLLLVLLGRLDCEVAGEAGDGKAGFELFEKTRPDLTLMDISMPGMNGVDALHKIIGKYPDAKVVMLTAMEDTVVAETCVHAGARGYIRKGIGIDDLMAALKAHLDRRG